MSRYHPGRDGIVVRLEVRRETGEGGLEQWSDAGPINLDSATAATLVDSKADTPTGSAVPAKRKRMLPRRTKLFLSPNAKVKGDRKENFLFHHSSDGADTNLLILLHGAGDTHRAFREFAKRMDLPQTATLSIHASSCSSGFSTLPFNLGYTWFEEMCTATGDALEDRDHRRVASLRSAIDNLIKILQSLYPQEGDNVNDGWMPERIFLFGYSAGACLVMETCLRLMKRKEMPIGGAVCVAGGIKCEMPPEEKEKAVAHLDSTHCFEGPTPVLLIIGSQDMNFPPDAARNASSLYNDTHKRLITLQSSMAKLAPAAKIFIKDGKGAAMIGSEDEMRCIMEFLATRLVRETPASAMGGTAPSQS
jgi:predicted esterase